MKYKFLFLVNMLVLILLLVNDTYAQKKKIEIKAADGLFFNSQISSGAKRLVGNVILAHEGALMFCDSALFYEITNSVDAFGKVKIASNDSTMVYGDKLYYNGNTKKAELQGNCKLTDKDLVLTTKNLYYDVISNSAYYLEDGLIINKENTLVSKHGYYYGKTKDLFFKQNVKLTNKNYVVNTDTMRYYTPKKISYFYGPTTIVSKENTIVCKNGWYDSNNEKAQFSKNAILKNKSQQLTGDSVMYDRRLGIGKAFRNITLIDTTRNVTVKGNYALFNEKQNRSLVTGNALLIQQFSKKDTLYLHADTLRAVYDSTNNTNKTVWAYNKAKFFKNDIQGMSDSLVYNIKDSVINMYKRPILWTENKQLTADTIKIRTYEGVFEKLYLNNNCFILADQENEIYDQVSGNNMIGHFTNNNLVRVNVFGNANAIYFPKEENKNEFLGGNKVKSTDMIIYLIANEIKRIKFIDKPSAVLYPMKDIELLTFRLENFYSYKINRPLVWFDIFKW